MKHIFESVKLKELDCKNRMIRSATWEGIAMEDGSITDQTYAIYDELAKGGIGTVITGFTSVSSHDYYFEGRNSQWIRKQELPVTANALPKSIKVRSQ